MVSTTTDLITFINALFNGTLVDSTCLTQMIPAEGSVFGAGLMLMPFYEHIFYGHAGDTYGTHTAVMHNPSDSISIAIAINGCAIPRNDMLIGIASAIYDIDYEYPDFSQHQQYTATDQELAQYAGLFNSSLIDLPMDITYNPTDGNLSLQLRGQPAIWLEAKSPGVFINSPTGVAIKFKDKDRFTFKQFGRILIYTRQ
jgi:D-alanyl-D-alanine carboxypeptidase